MSSCPVVGTPVGGIPEMVDGTGIVVSEAAASSLAEGIIRAASTPRFRPPERREGAGRRGLLAESVAKALVDVWERALATRRETPEA